MLDVDQDCRSLHISVIGEKAHNVKTTELMTNHQNMLAEEWSQKCHL